MEQTVRWFDRKFNFDHLHGTFPGIYERLAGLIVRLEHKLESVPTEHLHIQLDGKWSIKEQIGHLIDLESLWAARMHDFLSNKEELTPADLENRKTHEAAHNSTSLEDLIEQLTNERNTFLGFCRDIANEAETRTALHPRLKQPMRAIDLAYFVAEHDDHHLAAITEINDRLLGRN